MTHQNTAAEKQLLHFIGTLPLAAELKTGWEEQIRTGGMVAGLGDEIHKQIEGSAEINAAARTRFTMELARLLRQWRMETGARGFHR
jgi:hypothetical protein